MSGWPEGKRQAIEEKQDCYFSVKEDDDTLISSGNSTLGPLEEKAATLGAITSLPKMLDAGLTLTTGELPNQLTLDWNIGFPALENIQDEREASKPGARHVCQYCRASSSIYIDTQNLAS